MRHLRSLIGAQAFDDEHQPANAIYGEIGRQTAMAVMGPQPRVDHSRTDFISRACCLNRRATPSGSEKQFSICPSHTAYPAGHCLTAPYISRNFPQLAGCAAIAFVGTTSRAPKWIKPQLTGSVDE